MRIIGLDVGTKNIGVAVCDPLGITAQALPTVRRKGNESEDVEKVVAAIREYNADKLVVGLPKHMNGDEGVSCDMARDFAGLVKEACDKDIPVIFWDERLTSVMAENAMLEADLSRKKRKQSVDSLAAILILQNYLDYIG